MHITKKLTHTEYVCYIRYKIWSVVMNDGKEPHSIPPRGGHVCNLHIRVASCDTCCPFCDIHVCIRVSIYTMSTLTYAKVHDSKVWEY